MAGRGEDHAPPLNPVVPLGKRPIMVTTFYWLKQSQIQLDSGEEISF